jgi:hypothetical protein
MSLLDHALSGKLTRIRDGEERGISGSVNGNLLIAKIESDLRYGDVVRDEHGEQFVVQSCKRNKSPSGNLDNLSADVIPHFEWAATQNDRKPGTTVTQHIGSAHVVAGHDISGDININVTPEKLAAKLEQLIMSLPLPEAEKKSIWSKIGSAIGNIGAGAAKAFVAGLLK